jgi:hypothetical protein
MEIFLCFTFWVRQHKNRICLTFSLDKHVHYVWINNVITFNGNWILSAHFTLVCLITDVWSISPVVFQSEIFYTWNNILQQYHGLLVSFNSKDYTFQMFSFSSFSSTYFFSNFALILSCARVIGFGLMIRFTGLFDIACDYTLQYIDILNWPSTQQIYCK